MAEQAELRIAKQAAQLGGETLMRYFGGDVRIEHKGEETTFNLVSEADMAAEEVVVQAIRDAYPSHCVMSEESHAGDAEAEHLWIVDPLDGTNNFLHDIPHFAVCVAYYRGGAPQCGVIHNPARGDWYVAQQGRGAFHNGRQVKVADQERLDQAIVALGFYYDRGAMMEATLGALSELFRSNIHGMRRMGTASLDLAQVGVGSFGAFFEYELSAWDFAAGRLFVEEAGGRVTDCAGGPLPLGSSSVLASNGALHADVLAVVGKYFAKI